LAIGTKGEALWVVSRTGERARHPEGFMKAEMVQAVAGVIVKDIGDIVKRLVTDESGRGEGLEAAEAMLQPVLRQWAGMVLETAAEALREKAETEVHCRCGEPARYKGEYERQQETLVGPFRYRRGYCHCHRCGKGWYPLDEALGVTGGQFSATLEQGMSLLGAGFPYRSAAQVLETLVGVRVSASSVERVVKRRGSVLETHYQKVEAQLMSGDERAASAPKARRVEKRPWVVELDAAKALFRDGWHEVKVGVVCLAESRKGKSGPVKAVQPSYLSRVRNMEGAGERLYAEAVRRGVCPERDTVVCLADGAPVNWSQFELHFPHRVEVLDWYHAVEHVWAAGKAGLGEGSPDSGVWLQEQLALLEQGKEGEMVLAVEELAQHSGSADVAREARYFRTNQKRIRYAHFRSCGYPIGSGVVESACKQLVAARLKGPGMRWSDQGAQSVLTLRCALLGQQWDQAWTLTKAA
jgi:hypothetical protein